MRAPRLRASLTRAGFSFLPPLSFLLAFPSPPPFSFAHKHIQTYTNRHTVPVKKQKPLFCHPLWMVPVWASLLCFHRVCPHSVSVLLPLSSGVCHLCSKVSAPGGVSRSSRGGGCAALVLSFLSAWCEGLGDVSAGRGSAHSPFSPPSVRRTGIRPCPPLCVHRRSGMPCRWRLGVLLCATLG